MVVASEKNLRQLRAIGLTFRRRLRGFGGEFRLPLACFALAATLDALSTCRFMLLLGVHHELHPYIRLISHVLGPVVGPFVGKGLQCLIGLCVVVYVRRYARLLLWTATASYAGAAFLNVFGMRVLTWIEG